MSQNKKTVREPLIHVTRRVGLIWWKGWLIRLGAILLALVICALLVVVLTDYNPFDVFKSLIRGSFSTYQKFLMLMQKTAILLCISLAVTPVFKMKFWNLGAEGQVLVGGLATAACMIILGNKVPTALLLVIMVIASMLAGIIWVIIPAYFKAKFNTNETLFTLMMNYVAIQLVSMMIQVWDKSGSSTVGIINSDTQAGWLPILFGNKYYLNIIIVALLTAGMFIYLKYSKQGYEISVVGESENTARYIGINVKKVILRTSVISGAVCGIAGLLLVAGTDRTINTDTAGGQGFTAVLVSWLAKFNPVIMVFTSLLVMFLQRGANQIASDLGLNRSIADIFTGIILVFIIGSEFFINYKLNFRKSNKEDAE